MGQCFDKLACRRWSHCVRMTLDSRGCAESVHQSWKLNLFFWSRSVRYAPHISHIESSNQTWFLRLSMLRPVLFNTPSKNVFMTDLHMTKYINTHAHSQGLTWSWNLIVCLVIPGYCPSLKHIHLICTETSYLFKHATMLNNCGSTHKRHN